MTCVATSCLPFKCNWSSYPWDMAAAFSPVLTRVGYIYLCMSQPVHSDICLVPTPTAKPQPGEAPDERLEPAYPECRNVSHIVCAKS